MTDERLAAFHESGHAVLAVRLHIPLARVSLVPPVLGLRAAGYVVVARGPITIADADLACLNRADAMALGSLPVHLFQYAVFLCAGGAAERRVGGGRDGGWEDQRMLETLFAEAYKIPAVCDRVVDLVQRFQVAADCAVLREWRTIERVADRLLEHRTLDAAELMATIDGGQNNGL